MPNVAYESVAGVLVLNIEGEADSVPLSRVVGVKRKDVA
jgi:hypothetical protein